MSFTGITTAFRDESDDLSRLPLVRPSVYKVRVNDSKERFFYDNKTWNKKKTRKKKRTPFKHQSKEMSSLAIGRDIRILGQRHLKKQS
jgi:hypothetical protein